MELEFKNTETIYSIDAYNSFIQRAVSKLSRFEADIYKENLSLIKKAGMTKCMPDLIETAKSVLLELITEDKNLYLKDLCAHVVLNSHFFNSILISALCKLKENQSISKNAVKHIVLKAMNEMKDRSQTGYFSFRIRAAANNIQYPSCPSLFGFSTDERLEFSLEIDPENSQAELILKERVSKKEVIPEWIVIRRFEDNNNLKYSRPKEMPYLQIVFEAGCGPIQIRIEDGPAAILERGETRLTERESELKDKVSKTRHFFPVNSSSHGIPLQILPFLEFAEMRVANTKPILKKGNEIPNLKA